MSSSYTVEITRGLTYDCDAEEELSVNPGDKVVVQFAKHLDCGTVTGEADTAHADDDREDRRRNRAPESPPKIIRQMSLVDKGRATENEARAKAMFRTAHRKINEHRLDMKLINCHYSLDKSLAVFMFSSEGRVDFRNLVKDLSGALRVRVELRQVGVRDEASIQGGLGPCGRPFCCATFLRSFKSVNVRMAKAQRLSLNPSSVSGGCGRLKCCLRYEVDGYREMFRHLPRNGTRVETPMGTGKVIDCNALSQKIKVRLEDGNGQTADFDAAELGFGER